MILIILIFGLVLRLISINQSFWIDEATSALTTKISLHDFFMKFLPGDFHPPLYYLTLRLWSMFFGTSEIVLRNLSVLFGLATVYLVYLIGKELVSKRVGIIASLLLATSGLHVYYSQEARMYAMSTFLVILAIFSFVKIAKDKSGVGHWILFSVTLGLIGFTDYLPLLIVPVFWIYGFREKKDLFWFRKLFMSHIVLMLFAVFWSTTFIKQFQSGILVVGTSPAWVGALGVFSIKDILLIPVKFIIGRVGFENKYVYGLIIGICTVILGYLILRSSKFLKALKLVYLWFLVPLSLALIISIKIPVLNYFRFLFVLPAFYLVVANGIGHLKKGWQEVALIIVVLINLITTGLYLTDVKFQREDWRSAVFYVENNRSRNSIVIFPAKSQMEAYHYYAPKTLIYGPEAIKNGYSEIWLVRYAQPISDANDTTRLRIEGLGFNKIKEFDFNGVVIWEYK